MPPPSALCTTTTPLGIHTQPPTSAPLWPSSPPLSDRFAEILARDEAAITSDAGTTDATDAEEFDAARNRTDALKCAAETYKSAMKPVIIESPYAGDVERNRAYLNAAILDCLRRGETPYASHKMLVDSLDDLIEEERNAGIHAGFAMAEALGATTARVFYIDHGMSGGMRCGLEHAEKLGQPVTYRTIG
jgi:hypothetical protein